MIDSAAAESGRAKRVTSRWHRDFTRRQCSAEFRVFQTEMQLCASRLKPTKDPSCRGQEKRIPLRAGCAQVWRSHVKANMATTNQKVAAAAGMAVHTRIRARGWSLVWSGVALMRGREKLALSHEVSLPEMGSIPYFRSFAFVAPVVLAWRRWKVPNFGRPTTTSVRNAAGSLGDSRAVWGGGKWPDVTVCDCRWPLHSSFRRS